MVFKRSRERRRWQSIAHALYSVMVGQSRLPYFYTELGVPDTLEGRFDLLCLHMGLLVRRLGTDEPTQTLVDLMFADMDANLRETGVSDLAVGRRVRKLAEAFYGRLHAYKDALDRQDLDALTQALCRNLYRRDSHPSAAKMALYAFGIAHQLDAIPSSSLAEGILEVEKP